MINEAIKVVLGNRDPGDKLCRIVSGTFQLFFSSVLQTRRQESQTINCLCLLRSRRRWRQCRLLKKMRGLGESKWHVGENEFLPPSSSLTQLMMGVGCTSTMLLCGEPDRLQRSINVESNRRLLEPTRFCCRKLGALTLYNMKYEAKDFNILLNSVNICSLL